MLPHPGVLIQLKVEIVRHLLRLAQCERPVVGIRRATRSWDMERNDGSMYPCTISRLILSVLSVGNLMNSDIRLDPLSSIRTS